jgi:hypothetical protein
LTRGVTALSDQPGERPRQAPGGVLVVGQDVREPDQAVGASRDDLGEIARHGPPLSRPITGQVTGFALEWAGRRHGVLWISGDTVLYGGLRQVAERELERAPGEIRDLFRWLPIGEAVALTV